MEKKSLTYGRYYLAYGSNLNLKQMQNICKYFSLEGKMVLKDYRLAYKGVADGEAFLTIEPSEGSYVPVAIYKINVISQVNLDKYEGCPLFYHKEYMNIDIDGKNKKALIYVMNDEFNYYLPSQEYVKICKEGYSNFGFDEIFLDDAYLYSFDKEDKQKLK